MGKPTGFMEIDRQTSREIAPEERIKNFNEFHIPLHCDEQQAQGARCMDCGVPFCQSGMMIGGMASGCPLNNLIPEWNDLVYQGRWDLAAKRLIATNRYPEFTSRVCPALCEAACTCGMATGSPVAVKENERAIVEYGYESGTIHAVPPPARTGKRVAVVGTGPSGLSVADLLNKRGHKVTMYERADRVGGLLMYGIPNMKLEKWVIDRRVKILEEEGIEFITNADVGRDISAEELKENYDAVVLCCGAKKPRDIGVPGRDAEDLLCRGLPDQRDKKSTWLGFCRRQGRHGQGQEGAGHRRRRHRQRLRRHRHPSGLHGYHAAGNDALSAPDPRSRQRMAGVAAGAENRLRPAGGYCHVRPRPRNTRPPLRVLQRTKPGRSAGRSLPVWKARWWMGGG